MSILDNKHVQKYFASGDCTEGNAACCLVPRCMALRILEAMTQPIQKGERYLQINELGLAEESVLSLDPVHEKSAFHPNFLRLPDRFQAKQECICECHKNIEHVKGYCPCVDHRPSPSKVDETINNLKWAKASIFQDHDCTIILRKELADLIRLVREEK